MSQEVNQLGEVTPDIRVYKENGSGEMNITVRPVERFRPISFTLHTAAPVTDDLVITIDSVSGTAYDAARLKYESGWNNDVVLVFEPEEFYSKGNALVFAFANSGNTNWAMTFNYEIL